MGGNRSTRRKPTTFGRALAKSFHMAIISRHQLDLNPTISEVKGARRDDCATKAPEKKRKHINNIPNRDIAKLPHINPPTSTVLLHYGTFFVNQLYLVVSLIQKHLKDTYSTMYDDQNMICTWSINKVH
jgi:hypothetical protein